MGPQPSSLNCKINELNEKNQVTANKEFFAKQIQKREPTEQSGTFSQNYPTQNVIGNKSPPPDLTRATSQKNLSVRQSRQTVKTKIFIPQHQSLTKVSQTPFKSSVREKRFYVQDKIKTLSQIIQPRYNTMKHFPYSQILGLTESLAYGLAYMAKKNCNHHDFYPTNIYYLDGKFKIINPLQIKASGFYLTSQRQRFSFLSPQLIIAILDETSENEIGEENLGKADIFAIGMILLEICSLQPSSQCYDAESYNIIDSIIRQRLAKVSKVYSPIMAECINLMLQYEIERRIDPLTLGQLIHWKVENQKLVAMQMQAPKPQSPVPQQIPMGPNGRGMMPPQQGMLLPQGMPPNMIPPQQIRGPPPPTYNHQPFKLQNLNQNVIAVTIPNQQFTRIGPNNQGFLSSSSLQQKLRVIQLIKQHPQQDEEVECESRIEQDSKIQENKNNFNNAINLNINANANNMRLTQNKIMVQREELKPQYPFVQSIYSEKPLVQGYSELEQNLRRNQPYNQPLVMGENRQYLSQQTSQLPKISTINQNLLQVNNMQNMTNYQYQSQQRKIQQPRVRNQEKTANLFQKLQERSIETFSSQEIPPPQIDTYEQRNTKIMTNNTPHNQLQQNNQFQFKSTQQPLQYQPLPRGKIETQTFVSSYSYGNTTNPLKNPNTVANVYTTQQFNSPQKFNPISSKQSLHTKKYGTSFQSESQSQSIQQRVQRVLNMSRNAK